LRQNVNLTDRRYDLTLHPDEYARLRELMRLLGWDEQQAVAQIGHEGLGLLQLAAAQVSRQTGAAVDAAVRALLLPMVRHKPGYSGGLSEDEVMTGALVVGIEARVNELPERAREHGAFAHAIRSGASFVRARRASGVALRAAGADVLQTLAAARLAAAIDPDELAVCRLVPFTDERMRQRAGGN
jgi:hypothetical protein